MRDGSIPRVCAAEGCERPTRRNGLCNAHHLQAKAGKPFTTPRPQRGRSTPAPPCAEPGCTATATRRDMCSTHASARRRREATRPCGFDGCPKVAHSGPLCVGHYQQQKKGQPLTMLAARVSQRSTLEERMVLKTDRGGPLQSHMETQCWQWIGTKHPEGYGSIKPPQQRLSELAHRVAWHIVNGPIPEGSRVLQVCGNRLCVRPEHLTVQTDEERFWAKVDKENGPIIPHVGTRCWIWHGGRDSGGYGTFLLDGITVGAHRAAWIFEHGPIADPLAVIRHECDVPSCVRHLAYGSEQDNCRDKFERGRAACVKGEANPRALVTEEQVREIRRRHAAGETQLALAAEFGVGKTTMGHIIHGRSWKDVA